MPSRAPVAHRLAATLLSIVVVGACANGASAPSAHLEATPSVASAPTDTPTAMPRPTRSTASSPSLDELAASLKIGEPYKLVRSPSSEPTSLTVEVGGRQIDEVVSGWEIWRDGHAVAVMMVVDIPSEEADEDLLESYIRTAAERTKGTVAFTSINGIRIATSNVSSSTSAMFLWKGDFIIVVGYDPDETQPAVTSLVLANS